MNRFYRTLIMIVFMANLSSSAAQLPENLLLQEDFYKTATPAEVKKLLAGFSLSGVSVAEGFYDSLTPLMRAAKDTPYPEVIDLLMRAGSDVNAYAQPRQTPEKSDYRARQNERTALHFSVKNPNPEILQALLKYKPDLEAEAFPGFTGTALYMAADSSSTFKHFMLLLEAGADATKDYSDYIAPGKIHFYQLSPLWRKFVGRAAGYALNSEKEPLRDPSEAAIMAEALLKAGSLPDKKILGLALYGGQNQVARLLLAAGISPKDDEYLILALTRPNAYAESRIPYTDPDIIELLIKHNPVNYSTKYGETPLLMACQSGANVAVVRMLIEAGARLDSKLPSGAEKKAGYVPSNAMLIEVMQGPRDNPELVNYLLSIGLSPTGGEEEPLRLAASKCFKPLSARELVKAGADPNVLIKGLTFGREFLRKAGILDRNDRLLLKVEPSPAIIRQKKAEHDEILTWAKRNRRVSIYNRRIYACLSPDEVRELVGRRNLDKIHSYTTTQRPASYGGFLEFFDGLRPSEKIRHETTAMIEAVMYTPYPEVIDILAKAGCDARSLDSKVLSFAMENPNPDVLAAVLRHRADLQRISISDVAQGIPEYIPILIAAGWDLEKNGGKALLQAAYRKNTPVVRMLMQAGSDLNESGQDGKRALNHLISNRDYELALEMIDAGANCTYKDKFGRDLLHEAYRYRPTGADDENAYRRLVVRLEKEMKVSSK